MNFTVAFIHGTSRSWDRGKRAKIEIVLTRSGKVHLRSEIESPFRKWDWKWESDWKWKLDWKSINADDYESESRKSDRSESVYQDEKFEEIWGNLRKFQEKKKDLHPLFFIETVKQVHSDSDASEADILGHFGTPWNIFWKFKRLRWVCSI